MTLLWRCAPIAEIENDFAAAVAVVKADESLELADGNGRRLLGFSARVIA